MKLFSEFNKVFQIDNISISERLNTAEASFTTKFQILPSIEAIRSLCNLISDRDDFCLTFKSDSDDIVYVTNQSFASLDFSILTENLSPEDDIDVKIQIDKKVSDGKFSIYDFSSFSKDLSQRPILEVLRWFSNQLHRERYLKFEIYDDDISFSTRTMAFESSENATFKPKIDRNQRLNDCKDAACFYKLHVFTI